MSADLLALLSDLAIDGAIVAGTVLGAVVGVYAIKALLKAITMPSASSITFYDSKGGW